MTIANFAAESHEDAPPRDLIMIVCAEHSREIITSEVAYWLGQVVPPMLPPCLHDV